MSATTAQIRELRQSGWSFLKICKHVHKGMSFVVKACEDLPMPEKGRNYRIGRFLGANPTLSNEQVAKILKVDAELVAERRRKMDPIIKRNYLRATRKADDIDRGKRISPFIVRQICSKGQRTKWQLQALTVSTEVPLNMIEIVRSVEAAGLVIHPRSGLIHSPESCQVSS